MATAAPYAPQDFEIGRVFGMIFGVIGRNAPLYFGSAFVIAGLPQLLYQYFVVQSMTAPSAGDPNALAAVYGKFWYFGLFSLVMLLFRMVLQAALTGATIEDLNGRRPNLGKCVSTAISVLPQAIGISILTGIAIMIGFMFLAVPGIILALGWSVVIPVLVQERSGVIESMNRSRALTKGSRWRLFGLFLVIVLAAGLLQVVLAFLATTVFSVGGVGIATAVGSAISQTVSAVFLTAAVASSYVELRQVREGTAVNELAAIFA